MISGELLPFFVRERDWFFLFGLRSGVCARHLVCGLSKENLVPISVAVFGCCCFLGELQS